MLLNRFKTAQACTDEKKITRSVIESMALRKEGRRSVEKKLGTVSSVPRGGCLALHNMFFTTYYLYDIL
jgi:hypothetical protein